MNLTVIIPVYNEADHINEILKRVQATKLAKEIIVVDDGSKDGTRDLLQKMNGKKRCVSFSMNAIEARGQPWSQA